MKFVKFKDANREALGLHYHLDPAGYIVLALEFDKKDINALRSGDKLYVVAGPGLKVPPPIMITLDTPFDVASMNPDRDSAIVTNMHVHNEKTDTTSPGDDK